MTEIEVESVVESVVESIKVNGSNELEEGQRVSVKGLPNAIQNIKCNSGGNRTITQAFVSKGTT